MTFFCSKFARTALFFKSEKDFLLCASESYAIVNGDNRQMKADYTLYNNSVSLSYNGDNRQMKADYTIR